MCKERALGTRSLLIPAPALHVQMHELCVCPMLVLNAYLHPENPQDPVFDLMCVPSVMQRKCKASKMAGAGLLQSPLPVVEDGSMGLRLCNSESPFSIPGSECPLRATRHHNNKWPECNCAATILSLTSYSSRTCINVTTLGNQACISRHLNRIEHTLPGWDSSGMLGSSRNSTFPVDSMAREGVHLQESLTDQ